MPLLKHGRPAEDVWVAIGDDEALPADSPAILSVERWRRDREVLRGHNGPLGIRLDSDQSPALVAEDLSRFALVVLDFPVFRDGRPFSYARLLRERYGFAGEIRATGHVLQDQYLFLHRCGIDALEVADAGAEERWQQALSEISAAYQPATDRRPWIGQLRRQATAAAQAAE